MNKADIVAASSARALIEESYMAGKTPEEIMVLVAQQTGEAFDLDDIKEYHKQYILKGRSLVSECIDVAKNLATAEIPPVNEADQLAKYFSFKSTNDDLELIYNRIRELKSFASLDNADDTFDARIVKYLDQAEKIRNRVVKNQFENLRKAILLNIGKKIALAAINSFMPYILSGKKDEARERFLKAIQPLIDSEMAPPVPDDIKDIDEGVNGQ